MSSTHGRSLEARDALRAAAASVLRGCVNIAFAAAAHVLHAHAQPLHHHLGVFNSIWGNASAGSRSCASCLLHLTRAQYGEDLILMPALLAAITSADAAITSAEADIDATGSFVEIGALDGMLFSNTLALERCLGWHGLLIEGNPANFEKLLASGRTAKKVHSAVCAGEGYVEMTASGGAVASQVDATSSSHRAQWGRVQGNTTVRVPCTRLDSLMDRAGLTTATFLSVDVEGAEDRVMQNVDLRRFKVVAVEADGRDEAKDLRVHKMLLAAGFRLADGLSLPITKVYVRSDVPMFPGMGRVARDPDGSRSGPWGPGGTRFKSALAAFVSRRVRLAFSIHRDE